MSEISVRHHFPHKLVLRCEHKSYILKSLNTCRIFDLKISTSEMDSQWVILLVVIEVNFLSEVTLSFRITPNSNNALFYPLKETFLNLLSHNFVLTNGYFKLSPYSPKVTLSLSHSQSLAGHHQPKRLYSHSYWLVIFCTTNSSRVLARERWQTVENSWKISQY